MMRTTLDSAAISGTRKGRPNYTAEFKQQIVAAVSAPSAAVLKLAMAHQAYSFRIRCPVARGGERRGANSWQTQVLAAAEDEMKRCGTQFKRVRNEYLRPERTPAIARTLRLASKAANIKYVIYAGSWRQRQSSRFFLE